MKLDEWIFLITSQFILYYTCIMSTSENFSSNVLQYSRYQLLQLQDKVSPVDSVKCYKTIKYNAKCILEHKPTRRKKKPRIRCISTLITNRNLNLIQKTAGCKALSFFRIYCKSTNYIWMFCEGFYLHRLISNAFKPPKSLYPLYLTGWGLPLIYSVIYAALRASLANESCWAKSFGQYEWIIYAPNLLCLVVNLFFLCNILRVLVTQLQTHPNEPSHFRRALKATFVLIPLFGIQLFVTLYRVPAGSEAAGAYEKFTTFVINSQGFFVALIFCFCNGEVMRTLRNENKHVEFVAVKQSQHT